MSAAFKLIWVKFRDHSTAGEWVDDENIDVAYTTIIQACGWLLRETKTHLILGNFMHGETAASACRMRIMKGTIIKQRRLTIP